jgi:AraC family transcriptional regulator of adaptative response/methylated-DNA-[protein]-cysteine methyltransferase
MSTLPSADRMYRALAERDSGFEGLFVVGVRTTGIFCRAGCPAKKPRRENCDFFASSQEALRAGYRPCLRCKPLDRARPAPAAVTVLLERIERDPASRIADVDLRALGIDPSTARRSFKKHCGLTFQAYQRARRMGVAFDGIRTGKSVAQSTAESGYRSFSGFGAAFSKIFGKPPSKAPASGCLFADWIPTPLGPMVAVADDRALWLLEFHDRRALPREIDWVRRRVDAAIVPGTNPILRGIGRELAEYFSGARATFATPLHLDGSEFQVRVWRQLLAIEPGRTRSYGDMARSLGCPEAQRAIGRANGENRLALVVPCHRVIRSDGTLCGYGGGIWRKRWLLDHEAAMKRSG